MTRKHRLVRQQWIAKPLSEVFAFFASPQNLEVITPPWLNFQILRAEKELHTGSLIEYRLRVHGLPMRWKSEISEWDPPHRFIDTQLSGPYSFWRHQHTFDADNDGTRIRDQVDYALPFGPIGELVHTLMVRRDIESIFAFRQNRLLELLGR